MARGAGSSTRIDGFTIANGRADWGGGININQNASPVIVNNIITGNQSHSDGGGIVCMAGCSPVIATNKITNNGAMIRGGGISTDTGSAIITNNVIACNSAATGGGIACGDPDNSVASTEYLINNTIFGNAAVSGAGICLYSLSSAHVSNNIVAYNTSGIRKESGTGAPVLKKNDVYSNVWSSYSGLSAGATDIASNPSLASSTYGQVHIQPTSPCKDTGDNTEVVSGYADMDNQTRIQNTTVDIGADESDGTTWTVTPATVRVTTTGNDTNNGSAWDNAHAKRTIQAAVSAAAATGGEVWVKAGTYTGPVYLTDRVYIYGGFAGTESSKSQRNWTTNVTIIDGGSATSAAEAARSITTSWPTTARAASAGT